MYQYGPSITAALVAISQNLPSASLQLFGLAAVEFLSNNFANNLGLSPGLRHTATQTHSHTMAPEYQEYQEYPGEKDGGKMVEK